jgi:hypothetical protein
MAVEEQLEAEEPARRDARSLIGDALDEFLDPEQVRLLMDEVLKMTKSAWTSCPHCKKRVQVEVPDAKAVVGALSDLLTQAKGSPTKQQADTGLVINRQVFVVAEGGEV